MGPDKLLLRASLREAKASERDFQLEIPVEYSRDGPRRHGLPAVKIHLTFDEPILTEKMRAPLQQQSKWPRPRDLYDLWFILSEKGEVFDWGSLYNLFADKCQARQIEPDPAVLVSETLKSTNKGVWRRQLEMLMREVPDFEEVWTDWVTFCKQRFEG